jgi:hypothetical protein
MKTTDPHIGQRAQSSHMVRRWGLVLLMGWVGIVVLLGLAALCGLVIGLAVAGSPSP